MDGVEADGSVGGRNRLGGCGREGKEEENAEKISAAARRNTPNVLME
jgi:hypothetical protein